MDCLSKVGEGFRNEGPPAHAQSPAHAQPLAHAQPPTQPQPPMLAQPPTHAQTPAHAVHLPSRLGNSQSHSQQEPLVPKPAPNLHAQTAIPNARIPNSNAEAHHTTNQFAQHSQNQMPQRQMPQRQISQHQMPQHQISPHPITSNQLTHDQLTHNQPTHNQLAHNLLAHNQLAHNQLSHHQLTHYQLAHHLSHPLLTKHMFHSMSSHPSSHPLLRPSSSPHPMAHPLAPPSKTSPTMTPPTMAPPMRPTLTPETICDHLFDPMFELTTPISETSRKTWMAEEDKVILDAVTRIGFRWRSIAALLPGRSDDAVRNRWNRLQEAIKEGNAKPKQGGYKCSKCGQPKRHHICTWVPPPREQFAAAQAAHAAHAAQAAHGAGCSGSCYLGADGAMSKPQPQRKPKSTNASGEAQRTSWTAMEDAIIRRGVAQVGTKWSVISAQLRGRTEHAVRNRWHRLQSAFASATVSAAAARSNTDDYAFPGCWNGAARATALQGFVEDSFAPPPRYAYGAPTPYPNPGAYTNKPHQLAPPYYLHADYQTAHGYPTAYAPSGLPQLEVEPDSFVGHREAQRD